LVAGMTVAAAVIGAAAFVAGAAGAAPAAGGGSAPRQAVGTQPLRPPVVPNVGAYLGADPNFAGGPIPSQASVLDGQLGRRLAIVSFYVGFSDPAPTSEMAAIAAEGALPMVSVHCGPLDADVAAGAYDKLLRSQAAAYRSYGRPVLLRWFWEMNLPKIENHADCLGGAATAARDYVAAFRHIWTVFHDAGATNVAFVWAPSDARFAPESSPFYPGDQYVAWIGADLYDRAGYGPWSSMYASFYDRWSGRGKPLLLSETGAVGSAAQTAWLANIGGTLPSEFPDVHGIVYTDAVDLGDYRLVPGTAGFATYKGLGSNPYFRPPLPEDGWLLATAGGGVENYGCPSSGSATGQRLPAPVVGLAARPEGGGYWLAGADGSVYAFGTARSDGSMRGRHLNRPIVGIAAVPAGGGYWMVASDGGVFSFGGARFYGSMGGRHLNEPIVGIAANPAGGGYWLVASDGGIFTFGDARFRGSTGGERLDRPIVGMAATAAGRGYWLVASDGGVFSFGDAHFRGSLVGLAAAPAVGIAADPGTGNYRVATAAGGVYQFPDRIQLAPGPLRSPAVAVATVN
jgi:hypothetical protein